MNLIDLGYLYVSDFIKDDSDMIGRKKYPLTLILDEKTGAAKLTECPPKSQMWGTYWYRSGMNSSMSNELKGIVEEISSRVKHSENDVWLDIACNDGTLLKYVPPDYLKIGIDPADDTYVEESKKIANIIIQDYFSADTYQKIVSDDRKASVITTIAMFYDLEDPSDFIEDIKRVMEKDGVWVVQMSYTPLMLKQLAFDNICHEHFFYYSLISLKTLFEIHGLKIVDANINDANGGSIRVYIQNENADPCSFASAPQRDVCEFRVSAILEYEKAKFNISDPSKWIEFSDKIQILKKEVVSFLEIAKKEGKVVCGYGASTKGNTLLQLFGIDSSLVSCIAEKSPYKFGRKTVGTNIPIVSEDEVRKRNPDYLLVLPWHFINEFMEREKKFLERGGKFIIPCPEFKIIGL